MAEFLNSNIKYLRNTKGISQQELADKVGIDRSTISRIENNEIETTVDNAIKIADAFDIPLYDLVGKDLKNNSSLEPTEEDLKKVLKEKGLLDDEGNLNIEKIDMANKIYDAITKKED